MPDYFATTVTPTRPAPVTPGASGARRSTHWPAVLAATVLAGAVTGAAVVNRGPAPLPLSELRAVSAPATAAEGWAPAYVDAEGRPARWDPCAPVRYVVNPTWMPQRGRADLTEVLSRISAVSGLRFVDAGDTDEVPNARRAAYQPERYGERWAPLLVAWVPPARTDLELGQGTQGLALSTAVPGTAGGHIVTAQVALDADHRLPGGFGPGSTDGEVLLHELTHAVGLGHVDDATQVMYSSTTSSESVFGKGDRAGLAAVGAAAGCHPAPAPRVLAQP